MRIIFLNRYFHPDHSATSQMLSDLAFGLAGRGLDVHIVVAKTDPPLVSVVAAPVAGLRRARLVNWVQDLFPEVAQAAGVAGAPGRPFLCPSPHLAANPTRRHDGPVPTQPGEAR